MRSSNRTPDGVSEKLLPCLKVTGVAAAQRGAAVLPLVINLAVPEWKTTPDTPGSGRVSHFWRRVIRQQMSSGYAPRLARA